jgi:hypothetical protein
MALDCTTYMIRLAIDFLKSSTAFCFSSATAAKIGPAMHARGVIDAAARGTWSETWSFERCNEGREAMLASTLVVPEG